MRTVKVLARDLLFALDNRMPDTNHYLDTETGEVIPVFSFNRDRILAQLKVESDRYVRLAPQSGRRGYEIMEQFTKTVNRAELRSRLEAALGQESAFRNFRAVLKQEPFELKRWHGFRAEMIVQTIRDRLKEKDIRLELVQDDN